MPAKQTSPLLISLLLIGAALIAVAAVVYLDADSGSNEGSATSVADTVGSQKVDQDQPQTDTIAAVWRWESDQRKETSGMSSERKTPSTAMPFTPESVFEALQAVKLDDNGDVITDHDALLALEATLRDGDVSLTASQIDALQGLIRERLPGKAGEQTARIVGDYAELLKAEAEFNELYGSENGAYVVDAEAQSVDDHEMQYQELQALRELYLGSEVAESLFATTDANARYMFDSQRIEQDPALSTEEKLQRAAELERQHLEQTTGIRDWNERYNSFMADKQRVVSAALSEDEKRRQIAALMRQHFDSRELEKVSHLPLGDVSDIN
ncbi:lipase secretion chaperone [Allohahella marinimesophila]|uniref:Lipase chaperone n=1 Tax=Allohahella marinimesophila TaxID=1054972 RepID=A0ABP7NZF5_9GAMM